jgi:hypothetical protein
MISAILPILIRLQREPRCLTLAIFFCLATSVADGQEVQPNAALEAGSAVDVAVVDDIDVALKVVDESNEIDDAIKAQVRELYAQAKVKLAEADEQQAAATRYESWVATAERDIEAANQQKDSSIEVYDLNEASSRGLDDLVKDQSALEQRLIDAKAQLVDAQRAQMKK